MRIAIRHALRCAKRAPSEEEPFAAAPPHDFDNHEWQTSYGGSGREAATDVHTDTDGNAFFVGYTQSPVFPEFEGQATFNNSYTNGLDAFVTKFQAPKYTLPSGNEGDRLLWATYYGGAGDDICYDIAVGRFGNVFFAGYTEGDGYEDQEMTGGYFQEYLENIDGGGLHGDAFVAGLKTDDDLVWSTLFGGETYDGNGSNSINVSTDKGYAIAVNWENLFIGGYTESNSDFPWQAAPSYYWESYYQPWNNSPYPQADRSDGFLSQFVLVDTPLTVTEVDSENDSAIRVFPNPTNGALNVTVNGMGGPLELGLYDIVGQKVTSKQFSVVSEGQSIVLDLSQLSKGLYVLTCTSKENTMKSTKVIVN